MRLSAPNLYYTEILEATERGLRECFAREIFAFHDAECLNQDTCNCTELANLVAGDIAGDQFEIPA